MEKQVKAKKINETKINENKNYVDKSRKVNEGKLFAVFRARCQKCC